MTPTELRAYCDKYTRRVVAETICLKENQVYKMLAGKRGITEATVKLLRLSFPDFKYLKRK